MPTGLSRLLPVAPFTLNVGENYMVVGWSGYSGTAGFEQNYNAAVPPPVTLTEATPMIIVYVNYYISGASMLFTYTGWRSLSEICGGHVRVQSLSPNRRSLR